MNLKRVIAMAAISGTATLPEATIILGCWLKDMEPAALEVLREGAKADLAAASLGEAIKLCIEATGVEHQPDTNEKEKPSKVTAA